MTAGVFKCEPSLAAGLLDARTVDEVQVAIGAIEKAIAGHLWRPVGDNPSNDGPIEVGKDAPTQLVERVVNAMEACFELHARKHPDVVPASPAAAAQTWIGVPSAGLGAMSDKDVRAMAEGVVRVHLDESGDPDRPTVVVRDFGIGQHPSAFPTSLLSLHHSEKRDKPYLIGKYGHGGATTLTHSVYTTIASRRASECLGGLNDLVGITVVRYREGQVRGGTYEYLCGPKGAVLAVSPEALGERFERAGTRVAHVSYDLHRYTAAYRQQKTGLWALLNSSLFDPPLPIHITGARERDRHGDANAATTGRITKGNVAVLNELPTKPVQTKAGKEPPPFVRWSEDTPLRVACDGTSIGRIRVRVWVLGNVPNADSYVRADQAITLTISGQRHGQRSRDFLKECKLGFLSKRTIIQIVADDLTADARRRLFPSGREQQRDNEVSEAVFGTLREFLENDEIQALEAEAKREELAKASAKVKDSVRRKVARLIEKHLAGAGQRRPGGPGTATPVGHGQIALARPAAQRPPPTIDDSEFPTTPTVIEIVNSKREIVAGKSGYLVLSLNARNGYLDDKSSELVVEIGGGDAGGLKHTSTGSVRGGRARLVFGTSEQAKIGEYVVRVRLTNADGKELTAVGTIHVIATPPVVDRVEQGDAGMPDINWVKNPRDASNDEEREQLNAAWPSEWTGNEVGDVTGSGSSLVFRLNESFPELKKAIDKRASDTSMEAVSSLKDRYAGAVSFGMFLLHDQREKSPPTERPTDDWMRTAFIALGRVQLATMLDTGDDADG